MHTCKAIGCNNTAQGGRDFCEPCENKEEGALPLSSKYPDQYKALGDITEIDAFAVHQMFQIQDPSGCLQYASRALLMSGAPVYKNIREARDVLTRWLELNRELNT